VSMQTIEKSILRNSRFLFDYFCLTTIDQRPLTNQRGLLMLLGKYNQSHNSLTNTFVGNENFRSLPKRRNTKKRPKIPVILIPSPREKNPVNDKEDLKRHPVEERDPPIPVTSAVVKRIHR
jgi:hypothetical protein